MQTTDLSNEWVILQNQFDSYEKYSLIIKLAAISTVALAYFLHHVHLFMFLLILVFWLQDAIWKTFQSRIETRLLQLENYLSAEQNLERGDTKAYQFNSLWMENRPGTAGLIKDYFSQAKRPTVAFPYAVLLVGAFFVG